MSIPSVGIGVAWRRELGLLCVWMVLWAITGFLISHLLAALLAGVSLYLALHLGYTYKLHDWLIRGERKPPPDGSGVWQEIFMEFHHITQRSRKRKRHLKSIVSEFEASTAALPDGAVVLDSKARIVWFNSAAGLLLDLHSPKDIGQRIANLVRHPSFTQYLADPSCCQQVEIPSGSSDEKVVALRIIPYGNGQRLLIARDISDQKRLEAMRRDFVANASHELRTPLTVLRGYLEMMVDEGDQHNAGGALKRWQKPISEMSAQAVRMGRIIEDLLKLARVESEGHKQKQEVVNVPELLERLLADARKTDEKSHTITGDFDQALFLYGRPGELESVFSNLITNAVQYTPTEGDIHVRWWCEHNAACFSVTDTGIGIDARYIPRLTERFYRVDPGRSSASGGTGLGLAIVKHCLEHHESELEVASEINVGSSFSCRFPGQRTHLRTAKNRGRTQTIEVASG